MGNQKNDLFSNDSNEQFDHEDEMRKLFPERRRKYPEFEKPDLNKKGDLIYTIEGDFIIFYLSDETYKVDGIIALPLKKTKQVYNITIPGRWKMFKMILKENTGSFIGRLVRRLIGEKQS